MASQKYANLAQSTLASSYTAGNTTLTVQAGDGSLFPSTGDFIVAVDDPPAFFLKCTSRSGDVLTVSNTGQEGTSASNKSSGTKITQVITAGALDNLRTDISKIDTYANLPASPKQGDRFSQSDGFYELVYDGSNWQAVYVGPKIVIPSGSWSWVNQGTSTVTSQGALFFNFQTLGATDATRAYVQAKPGATWTCIAIFDNFNFSAGIALYASGSSKLTTYFVDGSKIFGFNWTNSTSFASRVFSDISQTTTKRIWLKVVDNGVNEIFSISYDGVIYFQVSSRSSGTFLTVDNVGVTCGDAASTNGGINAFVMTVPSFSLA